MEIQKKCPNCGALIPSLSLKCIECGYVFSKESESSEVARESMERLQRMLNDIDNTNSGISKGELAKAKATIITTFVVPNTKEAMINFLILSFSNIESSSETQDMSITMAWEARAIATYNLLKLQHDSDPQIESVLQKYAILEDKKELAKIDGRAKQRTKRIRIASCVLFALVIFSIPFIFSLAEKINYDPILVAIEEGQYDEAIDRISNDGKLKHSVEFYIDKLAASPLMESTFQRDYDSINGLQITTNYYYDGSDIVKCDYNDTRKNYELTSCFPDGTIDFHRVDSLRLREKLWSIISSPGYNNLDMPYGNETCRMQFDSKGRCKQITLVDPKWGNTEVYFKYNEQDIVIQQDIYSEKETYKVTSEVESSGNGYLFMDFKSYDGGEPELATMRYFDDRYVLREYVEYFSVLGNIYTIDKYTTVYTDRLFIGRDKGIPADELLNFNFSAELETSRVTLRDLQSGKGVTLHYNKLSDMEQNE